MCYLVSMDHNGMAADLTRSEWWVVCSVAYSVQWLTLMDVESCGLGMLGV
jgi:aspartate/tyrosine/aromatic aminotransferase